MPLTLCYARNGPDRFTTYLIVVFLEPRDIQFVVDTEERLNNGFYIDLEKIIWKRNV